MTDSKMLQSTISSSGYKLSFVAKKLGITYQALFNKINNNSEFKATEIFALSELLKLNAEQQKNIFFAV